MMLNNYLFDNLLKTLFQLKKKYINLKKKDTIFYSSRYFNDDFFVKPVWTNKSDRIVSMLSISFPCIQFIDK